MTDVVERRKRQEKTGGLAETIRTVVYAVLIALVVRTFAIEPFNIPSGSMIPTLLVGDYLFVSKYSYGYSKHSFPFSMGLFSGRIFGQPPERGDVAVFKYPGDQGQGQFNVLPYAGVVEAFGEVQRGAVGGVGELLGEGRPVVLAVGVGQMNKRLGTAAH